MQFKDHFSNQSSEYSKFRPDYPPELFAYISAIASYHELAWDCATGSGQAAAGLSRFFRKVIATDASSEQLRFFVRRDNIEYKVAPAENSGLESNSVDLITVAQALHWFDFEQFFKEVHRVLKNNGVIAIWAYGLSRVTPEIDFIIYKFFAHTLEKFWPSERKYVDEEYKTIPFPFEEIKMDKFIMRKTWELQEYLGYVNSWSAVQRYIAHFGKNPVDDLAGELGAFWTKPLPVVWPLYVRVGIL